MRIGTGQLACLILGILFVSVGGGMLGGRLVAQKSGAVAVQRPTAGTESVDAAATKDASPAQPDAESGREPKEEARPMEAEARPAESPSATRVVLPQPAETAAAPAGPQAEKPITPLEEIAAPAGKPSPEAGSKYVIQAMSTSNENDARGARRRVVAEGFPAAIFEANLPGRGRWFRVYVGPYDNEVDALSALEGVRNIPGFSESFLKELK